MNNSKDIALMSCEWEADYGYPTTLRHPRTMRQSGTEYANAIYHEPRDTDGITIVLVMGVVFALAIVGSWLGGVVA